MLRYLSVQNLAVIERIEMEFGAGFTALTGETGAGKSMLVDAVGLLLGGRATPEMVRTGEELATVQAIVDGPGDREMIVRREISSQGRSRAFVDGNLVSASGLRERMQELVELHGQHEHRALLDAESHLDLLDAYAALDDRRARVATAFTVVRDLQETLERLSLDEREKVARLDLLRFQIDDISRVAPKESEDVNLAAQRRVLANADRLSRLCAEAYVRLYDSDDAVVAGLAQVWRRVSELADVEPRAGMFLEQRDAIKSHFDELASFLRSYADGLDASPARLQEADDRLALLERLKRKYGPNLDDVRQKLVDATREVEDLQGSDERIGEIRDSLEHARHAYLGLARQLSGERRQAAVRLARDLQRELARLAMERTRVELRLEADEHDQAWSDRGTDRGELFTSPNPGEDLRPLARIASGGELSRFMLALRTLTTPKGATATLIFDEVDAGIGGRVADVIGHRLHELGERFQVLCITHVPQLAAHAGSQFHVDKVVSGSRTRTQVQKLDDEGRVSELARMIGGAGESGQLREAARELIGRAHQSHGPVVEERAKGERAKAKGRRLPAL